MLRRNSAQVSTTPIENEKKIEFYFEKVKDNEDK